MDPPGLPYQLTVTTRCRGLQAAAAIVGGEEAHRWDGYGVVQGRGSRAPAGSCSAARGRAGGRAPGKLAWTEAPPGRPDWGSRLHAPAHLELGEWLRTRQGLRRSGCGYDGCLDLRRANVDPDAAGSAAGVQAPRTNAYGVGGVAESLCTRLGRGAPEAARMAALSRRIYEGLEGAPSLKILHVSHDHASKVALKVTLLKKLPLLEDVDISLSYFSDGASQRLFEAICEACPRLKKLRMSLDVRLDSNYYDDDMAIYHEEAYVIPVMSELHSLELLHYNLTAAGLTAIVDSCPLLEAVPSST
ncbi:putative F-box/LRR-repeat protein 23 [Panicum miliaceum]|uniref:F-box/LRR-repeat protein 23 n=1 Tax=Panicum miliaceum TaxID=4540 RepID=A0A3L6RL86_PANMI|nr:putative F-box/LRR-repeat protein 23 [Panicum miliaceum]